jgi:hypothetical protein
MVALDEVADRLLLAGSCLARRTGGSGVVSLAEFVYRSS